MGQYWLAVNETKKEKVCPRDFSSGMKQMEHGWRYSPFMLTITALLTGHWRGDVVRWVGDYTSLTGITGSESLYEDAINYEQPEIPESVFDLVDAVTGEHYTKGVDEYYANKDIWDLDTQQYLNLGHYFTKESSTRTEQNWIEHPLGLLLASLGEGGGGDYPYPEEYGYGLFSGHRVAVRTPGVRKSRDNITDVVSFRENRKPAKTGIFIQPGDVAFAW